MKTFQQQLRNRMLRLVTLLLLLLVIVVGLLGCDRLLPESSLLHQPLPQTPQSFRLESAAFQSNGPIPPQYTCDGANQSPPLSWTSPPATARSLALVMYDPDAPGRTFVHWVVYDLPIEHTQLPIGVPPLPQIPQGGQQGRNDFNRYGYGGPCPPQGTHRYVFRLYALDQVLDEAKPSQRQIFQAIEAHTLAIAELMGTYHRQP